MTSQRADWHVYFTTHSEVLLTSVMTLCCVRCALMMHSYAGSGGVDSALTILLYDSHCSTNVNENKPIRNAFVTCGIHWGQWLSTSEQTNKIKNEVKMLHSSKLSNGNFNIFFFFLSCRYIYRHCSANKSLDSNIHGYLWSSRFWTSRCHAAPGSRDRVRLCWAR